ncbi:MAG TPA: hypothetical protein VF648_00625 [Pyrinomonadaceae bacterium]
MEVHLKTELVNDSELATKKQKAIHIDSAYKEIKPCPFCCATAAIESGYDDSGRHTADVICQNEENCGAMISVCYKITTNNIEYELLDEETMGKNRQQAIQEAVRRWNTRSA